MSMIDDIKRDREAGTPGDWRVGPVDDTRVEDTNGDEVAQIDGDYNQPETWPIMEANARRIARLPDLEAKYIALKEAADELAEAVSHERNMVCQDIGMQLDASSRIDTALARYREASQ